ncbi:TetR/AcrR family transcriptional regulator [Adhaeribacter terreus]|uniref:TetR/AcrR family transcriptional regulator n=1 Tax=Adhaeribacter terreus TaxID=529703 RepID=A0ABW0EF97_9BACT
MKEKILNTAFNLYCRYGIKSISMDTVAQEIGASKKTIYQWFENKDQLVEAALNEFLEEVKIKPEEEEENSVLDLVKTLRLHNQKVAGINVSFFFDLQKYHTKANQQLEAYLNNELRPYFINNLKRGKAQGFYWKDINPEIVANLCIATFSVVVDQEVFPVPKYQQAEVRYQVFRLFLLGILTPAGKAFLTLNSEEKIAVN